MRVRPSVVWLCLTVSLWTSIGGIGQVVLCQAADGTIEIEYQTNLACSACPEDTLRPVRPSAMAPEPPLTSSGDGCGPCVDYTVSTKEAVLQDGAPAPGSSPAILPLVGDLAIDNPLQSLKSFETYWIYQFCVQDFSLAIVDSMVLLI